MVDCVTYIAGGQLGSTPAARPSRTWRAGARGGALDAIQQDAQTPLVGRALALGRRAALATVVGNAGELAVQLAMVVEGVGSIVTESEPVFTAIRVAGAAYLIVLGVRVVRDRRRRQSGLRKEGEPGCQARW